MVSLPPFQPMPTANGVSPVLVKRRSGAIPASNTPLPGILNHPWMQKFGAIEHQPLETTLPWVTATSVPFIHLAIDDKEEKWGLFARDEMALLVGAGIFIGTQALTHKAFNQLGWFVAKGAEKDKGNFLAYAAGHMAALLHGAYTAMWFGKWSDKIFVHPEDPTLPVDERIEQSFLRSKPAQWLRNSGITVPLPTTTTTAVKPHYPITQQPTFNTINTNKQPNPSMVQQRSGSSFTKKWMENFHANTGDTAWAKAQKFSGYFAAVLLLPALRWNQYVTKDQKLDPEEAKRKRLELASRDFATLLGGNLLYLSIWITGLSLLEQKYPQIPPNYRKNIAYVFGDLAKTLNAGIFAVVFSKWLTARKERQLLLKESANQQKL